MAALIPYAEPWPNAPVAVDFDGTGDYLRLIASPPSADGGITLACWVNPDTVGITQSPLGIFNDATDEHYIQLQFNSTTAFFVVRDTNNEFVSASTALVANQWQHVIGVQYSTTSRFCLVDGLAGSEDTANSPNPTQLDRISVGISDTLNPILDFNGQIGHAAIWLAGLSNAENGALFRGAHPFSIRPESLIYYAPLNSPQFDWVWYRDAGGWIRATKTGTPSIFATRPHLVLPYARAVFYIPVPAAPVGGAKNYYSGGFANTQRLTRGIGWVQ